MILLQGQPPFGTGGPPPPPSGPFMETGTCAACIPIDQGALLLAVIGITIGLYHIIKDKIKNRTNEKWRK